MDGHSRMNVIVHTINDTVWYNLVSGSASVVNSLVHSLSCLMTIFSSRQSHNWSTSFQGLESVQDDMNLLMILELCPSDISCCFYCETKCRMWLDLTKEGIPRRVPTFSRCIYPAYQWSCQYLTEHSYRHCVLVAAGNQAVYPKKVPNHRSWSVLPLYNEECTCTGICSWRRFCTTLFVRKNVALYIRQQAASKKMNWCYYVFHLSYRYQA